MTRNIGRDQGCLQSRTAHADSEATQRNGQFVHTVFAFLICHILGCGFGTYQEPDFQVHIIESAFGSGCLHVIDICLADVLQFVLGVTGDRMMNARTIPANFDPASVS